MVHHLDRIPRITAGVGAIASLGTLAAARTGAGSAVLLVADPGLAAFGLIDTARRALERSGLAVHLCTDIKSDPSAAQVDAGAEQVGGVAQKGAGLFCISRRHATERKVGFVIAIVGKLIGLVADVLAIPVGKQQRIGLRERPGRDAVGIAQQKHREVFSVS